MFPIKWLFSSKFFYFLKGNIYVIFFSNLFCKYVDHLQAFSFNRYFLNFKYFNKLINLYSFYEMNFFFFKGYNVFLVKYLYILLNILFFLINLKNYINLWNILNICNLVKMLQKEMLQLK